jgi:hypothetical protein
MSIARQIVCDKCGHAVKYGLHKHAIGVRAMLKSAGWYVSCSGPTGHARYQNGAKDYCPCVRAKHVPIVTDIQPVTKTKEKS